MNTDGLTRFAPYALAALRIITALLFLSHGTVKFFGFPAGGMPGGVELFSIFGLAALIEIVCGVLILVGFFTRPAAFIASGETAFAYWMAHAPNSFFPINNGGEAAVMFCFAFLYLVFSGPGALSIDSARAKVAA
jgi:putative oxidoreductase